MQMPERVIVSSGQPDTRLLEHLARLQAACLVVVAGVAGTVLCGWLIPGVATLLPHGWALMKFNSALCAAFSAASLVMSRGRQSDRQLRYSRVLAALIALLAGQALFEHLTAYVTGLDTLLVIDPSADKPGLMSTQTACYFSVLGLTLLFCRARKSALAMFVDVLAMGMVVLTLVVLAGYCFGAAGLFGQSAFTRTSPQTLLCMVLLAFVEITRRAEYGYFSVLVGIGIGSRIARLVLPFVFVLPFMLVIGGAYTTLVGWLSPPYAAALTAASSAFALFLLAVMMAWRINDLERDLRDMSLTDELTGIFNRRGFNLLGEQALREARRIEAPLTVLFFDLDGLKQANDSFGHEIGSQFVVDVADLLRRTFRGADIVGRIGGDEFAVVTHGSGTEAAAAMARMREAAAALNLSRTRRYLISYSVGEASLDFASGESFIELVARADARMYQEKQAKKLSLQSA